MGILQLAGLDRKSRERRAVARHKDRVIAALQEECLACARRNYAKAQGALGQSNEIAALHFLGRCLWYMILAHLKGPTGVWSGYSLDLSLPEIGAKIERARYKVLEPKLLEILRCEDAGRKAELVCQFTYIVMCVLDPSGFPVKDEILWDVLESEPVDGLKNDDYRKNMGKFLEPLGFRPHVWSEDGEELTSWHLPSEAA